MKLSRDSTLMLLGIPLYTILQWYHCSFVPCHFGPVGTKVACQNCEHNLVRRCAYCGGCTWVQLALLAPLLAARCVHVLLACGRALAASHVDVQGGL